MEEFHQLPEAGEQTSDFTSDLPGYCPESMLTHKHSQSGGTLDGEKGVGMLELLKSNNCQD